MCSSPAAGTHDPPPVDPQATRIRPAGATDARALAVLLAQEATLAAQLGGDTLTPGFDWVGWLGARLGGPGQFVYLAEQAHRPIGVIYARLRAPARPRRPLAPRALLRRLRHWRAGSPPATPIGLAGQGLIEALFVTPPARRQGVARRLVATVQDEFARQAVTRVEISVLVNNAPALALWTDLGFAPVREHRVKFLTPPAPATAH